MSRLSEIEVEVLLKAADPPEGETGWKPGALQIAVLFDRHDLPEWMRLACEANWEPPHNWYKGEREEIGGAFRRLNDWGILGVDSYWRIRCNLNPLQLLALVSE